MLDPLYFYTDKCFYNLQQFTGWYHFLLSYLATFFG